MSKIKKISLVDQALLRLRENLITETYPAGSELPSEFELAEQFGVSKLTMRAALRQLAGEGWIEIHHGRPSKVLNYRQRIGLNLLPELLTAFPDYIVSHQAFSFYRRFMQWLSGHVYISACRKAKPSDRPILEEIIRQFREDMNFIEVWETEFLFHDELVRISENIVLMMLRNTHVNIMRSLIASGAIIEPPYPVSFLIEYTAKLINAICENNETALRSLFRELEKRSKRTLDHMFDHIAKSLIE